MAAQTNMTDGYNSYDLGDLVRVSAPFTLVSSGAAVDPTVVKCSVRDPSGNVVTYVYLTDAALVRDSAGNYHLDVDADEAGTWCYRWWSTGTGQAAEENQFTVRPARAV